MNKTFLKSTEKFLEYATTKFFNDVTYSLTKQKITLVHVQPPCVINHSTISGYKLRQHKIEGKEWRQEC